MRKGSLVFDPFVGTGSILVAATHLGGVTLGCDIDMRVIRDGKQVCWLPSGVQTGWQLSSRGSVLSWPNADQAGWSRVCGWMSAAQHRLHQAGGTASRCADAVPWTICPLHGPPIC